MDILQDTFFDVLRFDTWSLEREARESAELLSRYLIRCVQREQDAAAYGALEIATTLDAALNNPFVNGADITYETLTAWQPSDNPYSKTGIDWQRIEAEYEYRLRLLAGARTPHLEIYRVFVGGFSDLLPSRRGFRKITTRDSIDGRAIRTVLGISMLSATAVYLDAAWLDTLKQEAAHNEHRLSIAHCIDALYLVKLGTESDYGVKKDEQQ